MDVDDAVHLQQVDIVIFANQCEKTYAEHVEDVYMMESESLNDFFAGTAKTSDQQVRKLSEGGGRWGI